jgi:hypothetical protein
MHACALQEHVSSAAHQVRRAAEEVRTWTRLRPGRSACGRVQEICESERACTAHATPPTATAGSHASAAAPRPEPEIVTARPAAEAEVTVGVRAADAVYAQPPTARHCASSPATTTVSVGAAAGTVSAAGSMGWYTVLVSAGVLTISTCSAAARAWQACRSHGAARRDTDEAFVKHTFYQPGISGQAGPAPASGTVLEGLVRCFDAGVRGMQVQPESGDHKV